MADELAEAEEEAEAEAEAPPPEDAEAEAEAEAEADADAEAEAELPVGSPNRQPWTMVCDCCGSPQVCSQGEVDGNRRLRGLG